MKYLFLFLISLTFSVNAQTERVQENPYSKGNWFAYWGWNRSAYTKSDIHFSGTNYDFTLNNTIAKDRQSPFSAKLYFGPQTLTIPQYNFRIGYFFKDHYQVSLGADHMKYVMSNNQTVKVDGYIHKSLTPYDGTYDNTDLFLSKDFLQFEHTDGLNYENIEVRRFDVLWSRKNIAFALNEGLGVGVLIPRTNTTLLHNDRYDEFHLAGYGLAGVVSVNVTFFKYFFVQAEYKGGFIHMPDIRTTMYKEDRASQHFFFTQYNVVFGGTFRLWK